MNAAQHQQRVEELATRLQQVESNLASFNQNPSRAASSGSQIPPPASLGGSPPRGVPQIAARPLVLGGESDTKFNTIIIGGWEDDTRRKQILADLDRVLRQINLEVKQTLVYGVRANTAQLILPELPTQQARERFYDIQRQRNQKHRTSSGEPLWWAPSRSAERRQKNRLTRLVLTHLEHLVPEQEREERVDCD